MGLEFHFEYDAEDKSKFEVKEAGGGYATLLECNAELLKKWGLWKSFVKAYQDERQTFQEWCEEGKPLADEPPTDEEMEEILESGFWGPCAPFDPAEAKDWASKWMMILDLLSDEEAKSIFPLAKQLHKKDAPFGRDDEIKDLRRVAAQADCAIRHNVQMTMLMIIS